MKSKNLLKIVLCNILEFIFSVTLSGCVMASFDEDFASKLSSFRIIRSFLPN